VSSQRSIDNDRRWWQAIRRWWSGDLHRPHDPSASNPMRLRRGFSTPSHRQCASCCTLRLRPFAHRRPFFFLRFLGLSASTSGLSGFHIKGTGSHHTRNTPGRRRLGCIFIPSSSLLSLHSSDHGVRIHYRVMSRGIELGPRSHIGQYQQWLQTNNSISRRFCRQNIPFPFLASLGS
jgi:hypothetical protein